MDEFRIVSHIGFTYTTYITVKSEFLLIYYLDILIQKKRKVLKTFKIRIGLRHTYERVYNNDVFGESHTWSNNEPF